MKALFSFLTLNFAFSSFAFAEYVPNELRIFRELLNNENIDSIVSSIENETLNPFYNLDYSGSEVKVNYTEGKSFLFSTILTNRLTPPNIKGNINTNIYALDLIIRKGLNVKAPQPAHTSPDSPLSGIYILPVSNLASDTCNIDVINLMKSHDVDFSDLFNAFLPLRRSYSTDPGSREEKACNDVLKENIISGGNWNITSVYHFFNGKMDLNDNEFIDGALLDPMPDDIKNLLRSKYGIVFSKRPNTIEPDEKEFELMRDQLTFAEQDQEDTYKRSDVYWEKWWPQSSPDRKAWLCYYSSFDEAVSALKFAGWSEADLASKNIPYTSWSNFKLKSPPIGNFAVKTFVQYCNSIK